MLCSSEYTRSMPTFALAFGELFVP